MAAARPSRSTCRRRWAETRAAAAAPMAGRSAWTSTSSRAREKVRTAVVAEDADERSSAAAQRRKCGSAISASSICGCQRFSHSKETQRSYPRSRRSARTRSGWNSPRPGRTGVHSRAPRPAVRARSLRCTWRTRPSRAASPSAGASPDSNALAGSQSTPTADEGRPSSTPSVSAARAKSPCDSIQTSTPQAWAASARRASASAMNPRVDGRSWPGWMRSPNTRMPAAPRRAASSSARSASARAASRAAGSGWWKNDRVSTQETARPPSRRRARVSARPDPVSSGRAHSASSPSRKRSSTPS